MLDVASLFPYLLFFSLVQNHLSIIFPVYVKCIKQVVITGSASDISGSGTSFQDADDVALQILVLEVDERLETTLLRQNYQELPQTVASTSRIGVGYKGAICILCV